MVIPFIFHVHVQVWKINTWLGYYTHNVNTLSLIRYGSSRLIACWPIFTYGCVHGREVCVLLILVGTPVLDKSGFEGI